MLNKLKKSKGNQGFTIIEVMIVLAIAGLILLIVFLAVPALQRSSRNTQRKNDAGQVAAAVANFISNNSGKLPTSLGKDADTATLDLCAAGGAAQGGGTACTTTSGNNLETAKLGYYTASSVYINTAGAAAVTAVAVGSESSSAVSTNSVVIDEKYSCNTSAVGNPTSNSRSAAIFYVTEGGGAGNGNLQCTEQ
jgi:prepilin-type N-terminal cleavage/methylation domain-containing protein